MVEDAFDASQDRLWQHTAAVDQQQRDRPMVKDACGTRQTGGGIIPDGQDGRPMGDAQGNETRIDLTQDAARTHGTPLPQHIVGFPLFEKEFDLPAQRIEGADCCHAQKRGRTIGNVDMPRRSVRIGSICYMPQRDQPARQHLQRADDNGQIEDVGIRLRRHPPCLSSTLDRARCRRQRWF